MSGGIAAAPEGSRRLVHFAMGGLAFLLPWLTPLQAATAAAAAVMFNVAALPRMAPGLFRPRERDEPWRSGIVLYPITVLALVVLFRRRMEVAAAAWAILAAGDAAAGWVGRRHGRHPIPWNRAKTVEGSTAFAAAALVFSWAVLVWMGRDPVSAALLAAPTSVFAAFMESLPWRLDDNVTVPLLAALFLSGLVALDPGLLRQGSTDLLRAACVGAVLNAVLAIVFRRSGTVDRSGMIAGFVVGTLTFAFATWRGYFVLLSFFILGSASTRLGLRRKQRLGIAQEKRGARSARHALANCGVAVVLAFLAAFVPAPNGYALAFVCAYATAAFDTVSSEIGRAFGGAPVLITSFRRVPAGTNGAISWLGTLAGFAGALAVGGVAIATGFLDPRQAGIVLAAAFIGSTADSLLGATLESRGLIDNEAVNFSNTLVGALAGVGLGRLLAP